MPTALATLPKIDITQFLQTTFQPDVAKETIETALEKSKGVYAVITQTDLDQASLIVSDMKKINTSLEKHRVQMGLPAKEYKDGVDAYFKALKEQIAPELDRLSKGMNEYLYKQKQVAQMKADEEKRKLQEQLDAEKKKAEEEGKVVEEVIIPDIVVKTEKMSSQNAAGISSRRYKRWKVIDIAKVPVQYLQINEVLMNEKRKETSFEGESPIAGIEYYFEEKV